MKQKQTIKANKEMVFDFSRSIDLHKISTGHTNETTIAGKTSGLIGPSILFKKPGISEVAQIF